VGLFQVNIVIGILLAYASNFCVARFIAGADVWRYKLAMAALPATLFSTLLLTIPHSPRWLVAKARFAEAESSLRRLGDADPRTTMDEFASSHEPGNARHSGLSWARHRRPILFSIGLRASINSRELMLFCTTWATFSQRRDSTRGRPICSRLPSVPRISRRRCWAFICWIERAGARSY
jgi:hypothetical protein